MLCPMPFQLLNPVSSRTFFYPQNRTIGPIRLFWSLSLQHTLESLSASRLSI